MDDITRTLRDAWKRIGPSLRSNPSELNKRLARLDRVQLQRPPRAWCFAIRASDARLAQFLERFLERDVTTSHEPHDLTLTTRDLEQLAAPVRLPRGGARATDVARQLGTTRRGLLDARLNGTFTTRHVAGLGGVGGKPRPILSTDRPLDRAARSFLLADRAWSDTAAHAPGRIPPGLRVTLTRVPHLQARTPCDFDRDTRDLHPEHPLNDPPAPRGRSKRLPPPQKDYVWYKWKGDDFVGYDWRSNNPEITGRHFEHQRELAQIRERKRQQRVEHPKPAKAADSESFRGWRWVCPRCNRKVNLLFLPLPRVHLLGDLKLTKPGASSQEPEGKIRNPKSECRINDRMAKCLNGQMAKRVNHPPGRALIRSFEHSGIDSPFGFRHCCMKPRPLAVDAFRLCRLCVSNVCRRK